MHNKIKGSLGELKTMADLMSKGYSVFTEYGDNSRVDLIVIVDGRTLKIQCKAKTSSNNSIGIDARSSGPGYSYKYSPEEVDIFALYVLDRDELLYIKSSELCKKAMFFRFEGPKNNQRHRWYEDYKDFDKVIRD